MDCIDVKRKHNRGLLVVAVFKIAKGLMLLVLGLGMLRLLHKDFEDVFEGWINLFRIDPNNHYVASLLAKTGLVDDRKLEQLSALTLMYAGLFLTEGFGLYMEKRWAEWLSVIATASFLPIEIFEVVKHFSIIKVCLLIVNLAVVWFLVHTLRRKD